MLYYRSNFYFLFRFLFSLKFWLVTSACTLTFLQMTSFNYIIVKICIKNTLPVMYMLTHQRAFALVKKNSFHVFPIIFLPLVHSGCSASVWSGVHQTLNLTRAVVNFVSSLLTAAFTERLLKNKLIVSLNFQDCLVVTLNQGQKEIIYSLGKMSACRCRYQVCYKNKSLKCSNPLLARLYMLKWIKVHVCYSLFLRKRKDPSAGW